MDLVTHRITKDREQTHFGQGLNYEGSIYHAPLRATDIHKTGDIYFRDDEGHIIAALSYKSGKSILPYK